MRLARAGMPPPAISQLYAKASDARPLMSEALTATPRPYSWPLRLKLQCRSPTARRPLAAV